MLRTLGLDIGGANTKISLVEYEQGKVKVSNRSAYFPIWKKRDELPDKIREMSRKFKIKTKKIDAVGVTTTAELSDAYATKREGVEHILKSVEEVFPSIPIHVLDLNGRLRTISEARREPLLIGGANWVATAYVLGRKMKNCILVDTGTTTTDIIPIMGGKIKAKGRTDLERLISGELVYTGALRTNVAAIVKRIPVKGSLAAISSEYFAISADVNLILGKIKQKDYSCETPDGRGRSKKEAMARLARVICADTEMLSRAEIKAIAEFVYKEQVWQIANALQRVRKRFAKMPVVITGLGKFLARDAARLVRNESIIDMDELMGLELANAAPAAAVGIMVAEKIAAAKGR